MQTASNGKKGLRIGDISNWVEYVERLARERGSYQK
jgi:hypothetical protein